jgi:tetratricopeptide (TPR) repeat protein
MTIIVNAQFVSMPESVCCCFNGVKQSSTREFDVRGYYECQTAHIGEPENLMISQLLNEAYEAFDNDQLDEAERLYRKVIALIGAQDSDEYRNALHMLAFVKSHQGDFAEARQIYTSLRADAVNREDGPSEAIALHQLGMVERLAGEYGTAISLFEEEFALRSKCLPVDYAGLSANLYEQGYLAFLTGDLDRAYTLLLQALRYAEDDWDHMCAACASRGLGEVEAARRNLVKARRYFLMSTHDFRQAGDERGALQVEHLIAQLDDLPPV